MRAMLSAREPIGRMPRGAARLHQRVPDRFGVRRLHPQLVAEIAGEAGARHHHAMRRGAAGRGMRERAELEGLEPLDAGEAQRLAAAAHEVGPCTASAAISSVTSRDLDVEADARSRAASRAAARRCRAGIRLRRGRTPCRHRSGGPHRCTTPRRPPCPGVSLRMSRVTRRLRKRSASAARDPVLHHRRQVVERAGVADREVFLLDGA